MKDIVLVLYFVFSLCLFVSSISGLCGVFIQESITFSIIIILGSDCGMIGLGVVCCLLSKMVTSTNLKLSQSHHQLRKELLRQRFLILCVSFCVSFVFSLGGVMILVYKEYSQQLAYARLLPLALSFGSFFWNIIIVYYSFRMIKLLKEQLPVTPHKRKYISIITQLKVFIFGTTIILVPLTIITAVFSAYSGYIQYHIIFIPNIAHTVSIVVLFTLFVPPDTSESSVVEVITTKLSKLGLMGGTYLVSDEENF